MKHENRKDNIVDYMNGHLSDEQSKEFERELNQNPDLMKELNEAQRWQTQLQDENLEAPTPQFSSIEGKLKRKTWNWGYGLSTAAAVALVAVLFVGTNNTTPNNEFETLTDSSRIYSEPVMQMVLSENADINGFANEYDLNIVETYPNTQIIDVQFNHSLEKNLSVIKADERIVLLKKIGASQ
jgi:hypothetical protein